MADPIDALEEMIAGSLGDHSDLIPSVKASIQRWREAFGGDEMYIARRAHLSRHARIMELQKQGLSTAEISQRMGVTRQTVHNVRKSSSI